MDKLLTLGAGKGTEILMVVSENEKGRQASNISTLERTDEEEQRLKLSHDVAAFVENLVSNEGDLVLARVAHELRNHFGDEIGEHRWMGHPKLSQLLASLSLTSVRLDLETPPGYARRAN